MAAQKGLLKKAKIDVVNGPSEQDISELDKEPDDNKEKEKKTDIGLIISELVKSAYSKKTVTQGISITAQMSPGDYSCGAS